MCTTKELLDEIRNMKTFNYTMVDERIFRELIKRINAYDEIKSIVSEGNVSKFDIDRDAKLFGRISDLFN